MEKVNLAEKFTLFTDLWSPKVVGRLDDYEIKLAKIEGEFVWHKHDDDDEMFLVVAGSVTIELRDRDVALEAGEFFVVPRGVEHRPVAKQECQILLFERAGVAHTGDTVSDLTVHEYEHI